MTEKYVYSEFGQSLQEDFNLWFGGMTQTEIAQELGTQQALVSKWFKGERLPSDEMVKRIRDLVGKDISESVNEAKLKNKKRRGTIIIPNNRRNPLLDESKFIKSTNEQTLKPRIEISVIAGKPVEYTDDCCEMQPIIPQMPYYDFTIKVNGDSMMPEYQSGDEVACRRIEKGEFMQWGKVFVINSSQGAFIKRLYKGNYGYRCISDNQKYPEFEIPEEEVYSISLVVGLLRIY